MASAYTDLLRLEKQGNGENNSTWGDKVNTVFEMIEDSVAGMVTINTTGGTTTLSANNSSSDQSRMAILKVVGALVSNATIVIPASSKKYTVWNATTGSFTVTIKTSGGSGVTVLQGGKESLFCDGADTHSIGSSFPSGNVTVMAFFQAAAPTGWTQVTAHNNKALRVVSGAGGGSGGTVAFTTAFASQAVSGSNSATTLSTAQMPAHVHKTGADSSGTGGSHPLGPSSATSLTKSTTSEGGGGSHNHTFTGTPINLAVQYIDMILASKD